MKKNFFKITFCLLGLSAFLTGCASSTNADTTLSKEEATMLSALTTEWDSYDQNYYDNDDYTYSYQDSMTLKTVTLYEGASEIEFNLGSHTLRSAAPTNLLSIKEPSHYNYNDYDGNGTFDFLIADSSSGYMFWCGFVPNVVNGITDKVITELCQADAASYDLPGGYTEEEGYERFIINNDQYIGIVMECDNAIVSEQEGFKGSSMHGYYTQLYDKTTKDYIAQFIGSFNTSDEEKALLKAAASVLRVKAE